MKLKHDAAVARRSWIAGNPPDGSEQATPDVAPHSVPTTRTAVARPQNCILGEGAAYAYDVLREMHQVGSVTKHLPALPATLGIASGDELCYGFQNGPTRQLRPDKKQLWACTDVQPPLDWEQNNCELQLVYGKCDERKAANDGLCLRTCGLCPKSGREDDDEQAEEEIAIAAGPEEGNTHALVRR